MVYIVNWQEFQEAAEGLYEKSPRNTRYCVKWRATEGVLVLKITDNTTCLKYKTRSSIFLNRFESLNLSLMRRMQNKKAASPQPAGPQSAVPDLTSNTAGVGMATPAGSSLTPAAGGPAGGGVKKKRGKKKK